MSEQKSLPRRNRSRYCQPSNPTYTTNNTPKHKKLIPSTTATSPIHQNTISSTPINSAHQPEATHLVAFTPISNSNKYSCMPNQFRPIQHRTINTITQQQSLLLSKKYPYHND